MIRISVIIPIFNVERYLENTLNSLLNQTMVMILKLLWSMMVQQMAVGMN